MPVPPDSNAPALDFDCFMFDAIDQALKHEDAQQFLTWIESSIDRYLPPDVIATERPDKAFAVQLGRALWNAIPLPSNHFQPQPLPMPGRNDFCICGSGKRYQHCCAHTPPPPEFATNMFWPLVLLQLSAKRLQQAIADNDIPTHALALAAQMCTEQGQARKGLRLLEPLFVEPIQQTDESAEFALDTLCDVYDATDASAKKVTLLERIVATVPPSPLKSGAQQRLATIYMDRGESEAAWQLFRQTQQATPNSPAVGLLEVQLLMGEERLPEAQARAQFWHKRLQRQGLDQEAPALQFLASLANDPLQTMSDLALDMAEGAGERLQRWLQALAPRSLPHYTVTDDLADQDAPSDPDELAATLRQLGIPPDQLDATVAQLRDQMAALPSPDSDDSADAFVDDEMASNSLFLTPPDTLIELEEDWLAFFPLEKPFSTHDVPFGDLYAWEPEIEDEWMRFLEANPETFDSLEILDDIATALYQHPSFGLPWFEQTLLEPVLRRAEAIIRQALQATEQPRLLWAFAENRPLLRSLARLVQLHCRRHEMTTAIPLMTWLLELNPNDNHGFRDVLMNDYLRYGHDQKALALSARYPDDVSPDLAYGRVLALYRSNRPEEAQVALCAAQAQLPKVTRYLVNQRVRKPKFEDHGIRVGGDDQAWLYRDQMRAVWQQTDGALAWLKTAAKRC